MKSDDQNDFEARVRAECDALHDMLVSKNRQYGNSALSPIRVFSGTSVEDGILTRIDDKLARIKNARLTETADPEDNIRDLQGYLVLLQIHRKRLAATPATTTKVGK